VALGTFNCPIERDRGLDRPQGHVSYDKSLLQMVLWNVSSWPPLVRDSPIVVRFLYLSVLTVLKK